MQWYHEPLGLAICFIRLNYWAFQKFRITKSMLCTMFKKQGAFFLYKELHEPNTCGFERMSAMNIDLIYEYSDLSYEYWSSYLVSFEQLIKGTNSTSPCTHPCVFLLVFLETNPCPTLYPTLCFWKQLRGRGNLHPRSSPSFQGIQVRDWKWG